MKTKYLLGCFLILSFNLLAQEHDQVFAITNASSVPISEMSESGFSKLESYALNKNVKKRDLSFPDFWKHWSCELGGFYRYRERSEGKEDQEIELTANIFLAKQTKFDRIKFWIDLDYFEYADNYDAIDVGLLRSQIDYTRNLNDKWGMQAQLIFETQSINAEFDGPEANTFGALKYGIVYHVFSNLYANSKKLNLTYLAGPHYIFDGGVFEFDGIQTIGIEYYHNFKNYTISFVGKMHQNLENLGFANIDLNPNIKVKISKKASINIGFSMVYYDEKVSTIAYVLRYPEVDFKEFGNNNGTLYSGYFGINYKISVGKNNSVNTRY